MKKAKWLRIASLAAAAVVLFMGGLCAGRMEWGMPQSKMTARGGNGVYTEAVYDTAAPSVMASSSSSSNAAEHEVSRKIIRTADITLKTAAFEDCADKVEQSIAAHGGYIESLSQYGESLRRLYITIRVPMERLDDFLLSLEGAGRITDRSETTQDMTTQYQDNEARLETLYAKRDRLNELLLKAEDVSDLIEIESAIADTQYQIDSYETSQRSIDRRVEMSEVRIQLMEESPAQSAAADIGLLERMKAAFASSLEWLGDFGRDVLVFLVAASPVLIPFTVIVMAVVLIRRRRRK